MKKFLIILILIISCTETKELVTQEPTEQDVTETKEITAEQDADLDVDLQMLEREIDILIEDNNQIGPDHYQRLEDTLNNLELESYDFDRVRRKLDKLREPVIIVEEETSELPECNKLLTHAPTDLNKVVEIYPLGNTAPPDHTIPTDHMYLHFPHNSQKIYPLYAPGDIIITSIAPREYMGTPDNKEYSIYFTLCKDVHGYYFHVKEISDALKQVIQSSECESWSTGEDCSKKIFHEVKAGTLLGGVGHEQGNFDLGLYDYRTELDYIAQDRYGPKDRSLHIVCPLDYFEEPVKTQLYDKITREEEPRCGFVMQDLRGTLQGNWYYGDGGWETNLAFVINNLEPEKSIISIGGVFTEAERWIFKPKETGLINRKFSDVKRDGNIYCYKAEYGNWEGDDYPSGKIIVQMISNSKLKIEHQSGTCSSYKFENPTVYER